MFLSQFEFVRIALRSTAIRQMLFLLGVFALFTTAVWLATYFLVVRDARQLVEDRLERLINNASIAPAEDTFQATPLPGQYLARLQNESVQQGTLPPEFSLAGRRSGGFHHLESSVRSGQTDYVVLIRDVDDARFIAAENVERLEEMTDIFLDGLTLALLMSLLATTIAAISIARRHQARIDNISRGLERVSHGELDSRITLDGPNDDLYLLADRINGTVARLDRTIAQLRVQTANIAHDLRTPLARLRALLEQRHLALVHQGQVVDEQVLEDALIQIDQIVETFNAILRIARLERGEQKASFLPVDLGRLVDVVEEIFGPVVEDLGHSLVVTKTASASIQCDQDLIVQLLGNLIQNSLRHGADGQTITLCADRRQLSVSDQGPGIPIDQRERVLQPHYQRTQHRPSEGFGLGLALVNAICDMHGAALSLEEAPNGHGLKVIVKFP